MLPDSPPPDRELAPNDPALNPGWPLLRFLHSIGADEFAVAFTHSGDSKAACDSLAARLASASVGDRIRERTVTYSGQQNPRPTEVWRLDATSLAVLQEILPGGVLAEHLTHDAWAEDLCVYRSGQLVFGVVTHEAFAFLRLPEADWQRWATWNAANRRAT